MPDSATSQNNDSTDQLYNNKSHNYTEVKRAHALAYVVSMARGVHIGGRGDKYRSTIFLSEIQKKKKKSKKALKKVTQLFISRKCI